MTPDLRLGLLAGLAAYGLWGLLPLYFRALDHLRPDEMLAHRIVWSVPTALAFIAIARRWGELRAALTLRRIGWLSVSAVLIGANWLVYIYAVHAGRVMEASIGYYINPLVSVLFGLVFFGERLRPAQWGSIAIAALGVAILTQAFGSFPWIAILLALLFAFYGVIRKTVTVDARAGFAVEAGVLALPALAWLAWLVTSGRVDGPLGEAPVDMPLLFLAGPITAVPLILFAISAKRLNLSTIGIMQYLAPTLQFLIAALVFREPFTPTHALAFACIWLAVAVFTADSVLGNRKARRLARAAQLT